MTGPRHARPGGPLYSALQEELVRTLAAFRTEDPRDVDQLLPLYAEQLPADTSAQEVRLVFSIARQRATTYAPTPGELREVLFDFRRHRSHAPRVLPPTLTSPRFADAERWLAANPWAHGLVEGELAHLTRDWPAELADERARFLPFARVLVFHRVAGEDAATVGAATTLPGNRDACRATSPFPFTQESSR